jgi:hypothetical protein
MLFEPLLNDTMKLTISNSEGDVQISYINPGINNILVINTVD